MNRLVTKNQLGELINIRREAKQAIADLPCMLNRFGLCESKPVQSHTLSASVLRTICQSGELYRLKNDPSEMDDDQRYSPAKIGVRAATAFKGFCATHDRDLFVSIDKKEFDPTPENMQLLFFRAMAQEITKKTANKLIFDSYFTTGSNFVSDGNVERIALRTTIGLRDSFFDFDSLWSMMEDREESIQFFAFDLDCLPFFAGIGVVNPEAFPVYFRHRDSYDGRVFRNILFSVLPTAFGVRVAFAWFRGCNHLVKPLLDRFRWAKNNLFEFSLQLCLEHCECTYFNPDVWSQIDEKTEKIIVELMSLNVDGLPYDIQKRQLHEAGLDFSYRFRRRFTNSVWATRRYNRERLK